MVGQAYGSGITKELAEKLGVLDSAEGMEPRGPDTPMKALRTADVPKSLFKLLMSGLSDEEPDEDDEPENETEPEKPVSSSKWSCLEMLLKLFMRIMCESPRVDSNSGQFRSPDSGQFRP
jgi:hypothetical protein